MQSALVFEVEDLLIGVVKNGNGAVEPMVLFK